MYLSNYLSYLLKHLVLLRESQQTSSDDLLRGKSRLKRKKQNWYKIKIINLGFLIRNILQQFTNAQHNLITEDFVRTRGYNQILINNLCIKLISHLI